MADLISSRRVWHRWVEEPFGDDDVPVGVFTDYDSNGGKTRPDQWLHANGVPEEYYLEGLRFWTCDTPTMDMIMGHGALPGARYFVCITSEDTLYPEQPDPQNQGTPGHTLRCIRIWEGNEQPYPFPLRSDGNAGYRTPSQIASDNGSNDGN